MSVPQILKTTGVALLLIGLGVVITIGSMILYLLFGRYGIQDETRCGDGTCGNILSYLSFTPLGQMIIWLTTGLLTVGVVLILASLYGKKAQSN